MTKKNVLPVVVPTAICLVVAVLLGVVNMLTAPVIDEMEQQKVYDSLRVVLDGTFEQAQIPEGASETVKAVYKVTDGDTLKGHVVTLVTKGYAGDISITVGVDAEGKVTKAVITNQSESHGKSGMNTYTDRFEGLNAQAAASQDTFTGATVSSTAIRGAIVDAVNAVTGGSVVAPDAPEGEEKPEIQSPRSDDEILELASALVADDAGFTDVTATLWGNPENLLRLYKENGDKGYVAYVVVPGDYVAVATEAVVHINMDGDIENINLLTWTVGHGVGEGNFAEGFLGADVWHIDDVPLVSGATGTSSDFRSAVAEIIRMVTDLLPRSEKKLLELADELVANSVGFEAMTLPADAPSTLRALYEEQGDKGYVAYIVTAGDYVEVATEALVHIDRWGKIQGVKLLTWTVGHGVEPGDFAERFVGKTEKDVNEVELVTSATYTSSDLRTAIGGIFPYIPDNFPTPMVTGIVIFVLAIAAFVCFTVISRKRRAIK